MPVAYGLKSQQQKKGLDSQYFIGGLTAKLIGVTAFCLIYGLYYGGGDTVNYYLGSVALVNLMTEDFDAFYSIVFENDLSGQNWFAFNKKQDTLHALYVERFWHVCRFKVFRHILFTRSKKLLRY